MKPLTRYGILDDEGQVIRWVWDRPAEKVPCIEVREPRVIVPGVCFRDLLARVGPALL